LDGFTGCWTAAKALVAVAGTCRWTLGVNSHGFVWIRLTSGSDCASALEAKPRMRALERTNLGNMAAFLFWMRGSWLTCDLNSL
jgi:hypothetical protein